MPQVDAEPDPSALETAPVVPVPEVRDYHRINAEVVRLLDAGGPLVRLSGAEGQRLLLAGLSGTWRAVVVVEGRAGPELAAGLDAPGLTVVCRGPAADGAAEGLRGGLVVVAGPVGAAAACGQSGGAVVLGDEAGPRAGLNQRGGDLLLLGRAGALAGERQAGGRLFAFSSKLGPHRGHGRRGGRFVSLGDPFDPAAGLDPADAEALRDLLARAIPWLGPAT